MKYREEKDTMGTVRVPESAYYGPQTQRAMENFPISGLTFPPVFIHSLALIKKSAARVNRELGLLKPELAEKVKQSFKSFQWDKPDGSPTSLKEQFSQSNEGQFIPITYQEHWNVIRQIDAANNVSYDCK